MQGEVGRVNARVSENQNNRLRRHHFEKTDPPFEPKDTIAEVLQTFSDCLCTSVHPSGPKEYGLTVLRVEKRNNFS
jgi:hypothetical protein